MGKNKLIDRIVSVAYLKNLGIGTVCGCLVALAMGLATASLQLSLLLAVALAGVVDHYANCIRAALRAVGVSARLVR